ncbi:MAG: bifunctional 4-hydroxy-2-oxoglutarate aldolase/2-dehydro-3-deoxy-phosphogluconate aldolase [Candidatus Omnitrophota bacterium]
MNINKFREVPIIGILRGVKEKNIEPLTESIVSSGLKTVEITMNTPQAAKLIQKMKKCARNRLTIGAGTVLTREDLQEALDAGSTFIVLPVLVEEIVEYCVKKAIPVFPGALTPQEIYNAWRAGAAMVKVFPAKFFGPAYFQEIKGPFTDIELLACGGVNAENIRAFFSRGASAVAFGASVFRHEWMEAGEFSRIEQEIRTLVRVLSDNKI